MSSNGGTTDDLSRGCIWCGRPHQTGEGCRRGPIWHDRVWDVPTWDQPLAVAPAPAAPARRPAIVAGGRDAGLITAALCS